MNLLCHLLLEVGHSLQFLLLNRRLNLLAQMGGVDCLKCAESASPPRLRLLSADIFGSEALDLDPPLGMSDRVSNLPFLQFRLQEPSLDVLLRHRTFQSPDVLISDCVHLHTHFLHQFLPEQISNV